MATVALVTILGVVFMFEAVLWIANQEPGSPSSAISADFLKRLGGLGRQSVTEQGQWWRLAVAPLLHAGFVHVLLNGLALGIIGPRFEGVVSAKWFLAIFTIGCLSGGLFSLLMNSQHIVSVGASGGIMGLLAATLCVISRLEPSDFRTTLQTDAARVLLPTLFPALLIPIAGGTQDGVDVAAHLGGALGGLAVGLYLAYRVAEPDGLQDRSGSSE